MRSPPKTFQERQVLACLAEGWGLRIARAEYAPVGGGSFHWDVTDAAGRRYFVTADDLDHKGWLGHDPDGVFAGLRGAFDAAAALHAAGLAFVVAPLPTAGGETVLRLDARHSVALFPFVDGRGGLWGDAGTAEERAAAVRMLAELHRATPVARRLAGRRHLDLPGRSELEATLGELDRPWVGGPLSEPARELLAAHAASIWQRLHELDRLAAEVAPADGDLVITHGEPHPGNVLRAEGGILLVDWDTVGLAPPERDLWLVAGDELGLYTELTGRRVDPAAIALYRLRWALDDIASFTNKLRSPHTRTTDTEHALRALSVTVRLG